MLATETLKINDIVELAGGTQFIVTEINPSRPANPYSGVKVNGHGTQYKFGYKHRPRVIGKADANHPALRAKNARNQNGHANKAFLEYVAGMVAAIERDEYHTAKRYAAQAKALFPNVALG